MTAANPPVVTLPHEVTLGEGRIRLYDHRPVDFMRMADTLFPQFVSRSEDRTGPCYLAFDDHGFIGYCTSKANGKLRCAGSTRKNPWYQGDRWAMLRVMLGVNAMGGSTVRPSYTVIGNYAVLKLWRLMGLGCAAMPDGKRWRATGAAAENVALLDQAIENAARTYPDARAYAKKRAASMNPDALIPDEASLGAPAMVLSVRLPTLDLT